MVVEKEKVERFMSVMFNLVSALRSESEHCCKICGDLNEKELIIVTFIAQNESVKMSAIADYLQAPLSTLTSIVDKLVANKFLLRFNADDDRRVVKVRLDEKGKASYKQFINHKRIMAKKVLGHLSPMEQETLIDNISKLASSIKFRK
jgi:DNA-binding MarR family transcriptional regulator